MGHPGTAALLVAIAGPTCAGKTTLASALAEAFALQRPVVFALDAYYRDLAHLSPAERAQQNFDDPKALDWPLLREQARKLMAGEAIEQPVYDFATHTRRPGQTQRLGPAGLIVAEGLHALHDEELRAGAALSVYVEAGAQTCLTRRLDRDVRERARTPESVVAQFTGNALPMAERYVAPTREHAALVVSGLDLAGALAKTQRAIAAMLASGEARA